MRNTQTPSDMSNSELPIWETIASPQCRYANRCIAPYRGRDILMLRCQIRRQATRHDTATLSQNYAHNRDILCYASWEANAMSLR